MELKKANLPSGAIELYNRSAVAQGFTNAPWWSELADTTRGNWIREAVRRFEAAPHKVLVNAVSPGGVNTARIRSIVAQKSRVTGRSEEEIAEHRARDPLPVFRRRLREAGPQMRIYAMSGMGQEEDPSDQDSIAEPMSIGLLQEQAIIPLLPVLRGQTHRSDSVPTGHSSPLGQQAVPVG